MLTSIVAAVVILSILIIVHEAGHFLVAKRLGVRVLRFSIGYPPRLWGIRFGESEYQIGATPLGGYVRMLGEEVGEEPRSEELATYIDELGHDLINAAHKHQSEVTGADSKLKVRTLHNDLAAQVQSLAEVGATEREVFGRDLKIDESIVLNRIRMKGSFDAARTSLCEDPPEGLLAQFHARAFPTQRLWKRFAIVLAGPFSNLIFAPFLLWIVFMYGVPILQPVVGQMQAGLPAAASGLKTGDRVISINGHPTNTWADFSATVKLSNGRPLQLEVERGSGAEASRMTILLRPVREEEKTIFGTKAEEWIIGVLPNGDETIKRDGPIVGAYHALIETGTVTSELVTGIASIISGAVPVRQALGGPIMIAQIAGRVAHEGFSDAAMFTVMLSIELGLINLLPVPMLDGGHLLFFVCEAVRGKPLALRHREMALQVGLFLLVVLMAFVIFNDIARIVQG